MKIKEYIENGATILDVRTPKEYMGGHVVGSINIPLQELPDRLDEIRSLKMPLVLCCASGARSQAATNFLKQQNFDCQDGGS